MKQWPLLPTLATANSGKMADMGSLFGRVSIARTICSWLPLMKARHRAHTFLRLRVACQGLLENVTKNIAHRCVLHFQMKLIDLEGDKQAVRVRESGFLLLCLVPFAKRRSLVGGLQRDSLGLPEGMSQAYFDLAVKQHGVLGWRDGRLAL